MKVRFAVSNEILSELFRVPRGTIRPLLTTVVSLMNGNSWFLYEDGDGGDEIKGQMVYSEMANDRGRLHVTIQDEDGKILVSLGETRREFWCRKESA